MSWCHWNPWFLWKLILKMSVLRAIQIFVSFRHSQETSQTQSIKKVWRNRNAMIVFSDSVNLNDHLACRMFSVQGHKVQHTFLFLVEKQGIKHNTENDVPKLALAIAVAADTYFLLFLYLEWLLPFLHICIFQVCHLFLYCNYIHSFIKKKKQKTNFIDRAFKKILNKKCFVCIGLLHVRSPWIQHHLF